MSVNISPFHLLQCHPPLNLGRTITIYGLQNVSIFAQTWNIQRNGFSVILDLTKQRGLKKHSLMIIIKKVMQTPT